MNTVKLLLVSATKRCAVFAALLAYSAVGGRGQPGPEWKKEVFLGPWATDRTASQMVQAARTNSAFIRELGKMRTEAARGALLRIAYGELGPMEVTTAAHEYADSLADKSGARALLILADPEAVAHGLRVLAGQPVDSELMEKLKEMLNSDSTEIRWRASLVLGADTNGITAVERATAVAGAMKTTLRCKDAQVLTSSSPESWFDDRFPAGEHALNTQAYVLGKMKGLPSGFLAAQSLSADGIVRDFMILARGYAEDAAVRSELRQVLTNSPSVLARFTALELVAKDAGPEDLAALRFLSKNDRFQSEPRGNYPNKPWADLDLWNKPHAKIYPLRITAEQRLKVLEGRK
jgi:hypothetical protein